MRLLHLDQSKSLNLTNFTGKIIPPYAILSHRWGGGEVLFENLVDGTYKSKAGYKKILFCSEEAARDQLKYFWIDTCCIDKWNLRELSKSINSMFRWYQNATKCYVFMSDVSASTAKDALQRSVWEASFRASKWFTRGWTLQELIAPVSAEFFSSEGWRLGNKRSLEQLIHEITSIPVMALRNRPLAEFTVSERMVWAQNRETTEKEDSVYCLLGILNIIMPLSYGEGKEKALRRLLTELETIKTNYFIVPFDQNDRFIGRESQLAELEERVFASKETTKIAITGVGGIGKSQLALELAYRIRQSYNNCSVFWISASDIDSIHQAYAHIAQKLDILGWVDEKKDVMKLVQLHLSRKSAGQWLQIFDNADDANLGFVGLATPQVGSLIDCLPQSELGSIVFTTADSETAEKLAPQNIIQLSEMTPDAAQRMLENYLSSPASRNEQQEAKLLLKELVYLPPAIVQAAAYINVNKKTIKDYLSLLAKQEMKEVLELSDEKSESILQHCSINNPVATTWLISLQQIRRNDPIAADYLFIMACIDRKDILLDLLPPVSSHEAEVAIGTLKAYALITKRPAESALDLHRLVHLAIHNWLRKEERLGEWTQKAITRLLDVFPDHNHWNRSKWRRLLPHAKYALSYSLTGHENGDRTKLEWKYAMALFIDGRYTEVEENFVRVMGIRKRVLGEEHPDTLNSIESLTSTYWHQGRWKEAEELCIQVIGSRQRVQGEEHPDTLNSMHNLGSMYKSSGKWKKAEEISVRMIETRKRVLGEEHSDTLNSMVNLASTYWHQGRLKEAEELSIRALEIFKRVLGEEHPNTLVSMGDLAVTYASQGRLKEAEELEIQVIETKKRGLGEEHPLTLHSMNNLAVTYSSQGRWKEAEELSLQAMEIRKRVLGEEHPDTLTSMNNLALAYKNQDRWTEAEELYVRVIEARKRMLGEQHPDTLTNIANLAGTYTKQGRLKEAEELEVRVLDIRKKVLGKEHPDTLTSMNNLATTYWYQRQWKEAEELSVQVTETFKRVLGEEHPDTLASMSNVACIWKSCGRDEQALQLLTKCVSVSSEKLGPTHPDTITWSQLLERWTAERAASSKTY
jgi:tetratricopeptide (TPR) repeat protein